MEYWSIDQHDKWGRFGLWLHLGLDPYSGRFAWLKIWWCNRNPRLLINYYLEAAREIGGTFLHLSIFEMTRNCLGIPLITMSDRGWENNGIANMHTLTCHQLNPSLCDTLQHRFCHDKKNIKAEIGWSQFRAQWAPSFEDLFEFGVNSGFYTWSDPLEKYVDYWVIIYSTPLIFQVWFFGGLPFHGFRLRSISGSQCTILALDEQTSTSLYSMEFPILFMQNPNGLSLRTFRYGVTLRKSLTKIVCH